MARSARPMASSSYPVGTWKIPGPTPLELPPPPPDPNGGCSSPKSISDSFARRMEEISDPLSGADEEEHRTYPGRARPRGRRARGVRMMRLCLRDRRGLRGVPRLARGSRATALLLLSSLAFPRPRSLPLLWPLPPPTLAALAWLHIEVDVVRVRVWVRAWS